MNYHHQIYHRVSELPLEWNSIATSSIFLQKGYLNALEQSRPNNMLISYLGVYDDSKLCAIAIIQQIDLTQLDTFGARDHGIKIKIRDFLFKNYASKILIIGNNMLTGEHAIAYGPKTSSSDILNYIKEKVCPKFSQQHLEIFKDFSESELSHFEQDAFQLSLRFTSQPSMIFNLDDRWQTESDYVNALSKKYRDQYKRARKKADDIHKRQLDLNEIRVNESRIHELYLHVAKNAAFNTFFLAPNHFSSLKENLGDAFRFFAYFEEGKLIGFNTLFQHEEVLETYFLGYDPAIQREKMLYLNMLYDMVGCAVVNGFQQIQFGRTAMEIKSSVGAVPVPMFGMMQHRNPFINRFLNTIFHWLEPDVTWIQRHPFRA